MEKQARSAFTVEHLKEMLQSTQDANELERIGNNITKEDIPAFCGLLQEGVDLFKVSAVLVGMPSASFATLLLESGGLQTQKLRCFGETESLQHHLTMLSHDLQKQVSEVEEEIMQCGREIAALDTETLGRQELSAIEKGIEKYADRVLRIKKTVEGALLVVWSTSRPDLVESFSRLKEYTENLYIHLIGTAGAKHPVATTLYGLLEKRLFAIFGNGDNAEELNDEEPVAEALAKFSIWHVEDFKELGLVSTEAKEELKAPQSPEGKLNAEISHLKEAEKYLKKLGIEKIRDLKDARIFSRRTLKEYIQERCFDPTQTI